MGAAAMQNQESPINSGDSWFLLNVPIKSYASWTSKAACINVDIDFYDADTFPLAKFTCKLCEVQADCLVWAVIYGEKGIWGGTTDRERNIIIKKNPGLRQALIEKAKVARLYYRRHPKLFQQLSGQAD